MAKEADRMAKEADRMAKEADRRAKEAEERATQERNDREEADRRNARLAQLLKNLGINVSDTSGSGSADV
jgi:hypothetical protein